MTPPVSLVTGTHAGPRGSQIEGSDTENKAERVVVFISQRCERQRIAGLG